MSVRPQDVRERSWLARAADSALWYSFIRSPVTVVSAVLTIIFFLNIGKDRIQDASLLLRAKAALGRTRCTVMTPSASG